MEILQDIASTTRKLPYVVLTAGSFDGVHLGHQRILDHVVQAARRANGTAAVMTMQPHPREFFSPEHPPNLLTSQKKKLELFEAAGIDAVFLFPFNECTANMDAPTFIRRIIVEMCQAREVIIGHDFHFGKDALGDYELLLQHAQEFGLRIEQVPPLFIDGERVSSTAIRERLLQGDLEKAQQFLGRNYSIVGEVVGGRGIGLTLGFPTANIKPHHTAVPAQGVYIGEAITNGHAYPAAINIGIAPTIQHEDLTVEAYLLDFDGELRHKEIELIFHVRLRPEKKFASHDELIVAIGQDVQMVKQFFSV